MPSGELSETLRAAQHMLHEEEEEEDNVHVIMSIIYQIPELLDIKIPPF